MRARCPTHSQGATSLHGFDFARLQGGFDYRAERRAALVPVVGLDLSRFVWQAGPDADGYESTSHPRVNTFVFVGVMAGWTSRETRANARV